MTPREGFKYGFLLRCAEEGLTVEQAEKRAAKALEKQANYDFLGNVMTSAVGGAKDVIMAAPATAASWLGSGVGLAGIGAATTGALGGYGLAKMQEGDIDPAEIQREELISAYQMQAELARRKAIMEAAQRTTPRPKSHYGI